MTSIQRENNSMPRGRGRGRGKPRNNTKKPVSNESNEEEFKDNEVERQIAAIRALRDVDIQRLKTMIQLLRSSFSNEQLQVPVLQIFKENFPNLSIAETGNDGQYEVKWKDINGDISVNQADDRTIHTALLHRLSMAYPDYSAGINSLGGFEFSNKSVKTGVFGAEKLNIRNLVFEEPSDCPIVELKDGLQTPNANNSTRLSVGITPKTMRLPKCGEVLVSVHGSPLGVYKEDNMETIQETEDG